MAQPIAQEAHANLGINQIYNTLPVTLADLNQRTNTLAQRLATAQATLRQEQAEVNRLIPYVKIIVTSAGGCVGCVAAKLLGTSTLGMCVAAAGGALFGRLFAYYLTKP